MRLSCRNGWIGTESMPAAGSCWRFQIMAKERFYNLNVKIRQSDR
jgi:hypothetical protein